jgi:sugar/nucleoside kinase (ribokinase family)
MDADRPLDLACFSYLAAAQVLQVGTYPSANSGTVVDAVAASIAGDGPLTAVIAARTGLQVGLIANRIGHDPAGHQLLASLDSVGIQHTIRPTAGIATPHLTVIADDADTRTWFAALQHAYQDLLSADLSMLTRAKVAYLDCYQVLTPAAARAAASAAGAGLLLNLGGDPLADEIVAAAHGQHVLAVQTSLDDSDDSDAADAEDLATDMFDRLRPDAAVVTLGRLGALARTQHGIHRASAPTSAITHTHGAGAAFSAGFIRALLCGGGAATALRAGCEAGTAHCASPAAFVPRHLPTHRPATV